jgi:hypothetical protein
MRTLTRTKRPHTERSAVITLELDYSSTLDFGGINTGDAEGAIRRADKGGMVSGPQLRGLVTLINGGQRRLVPSRGAAPRQRAALAARVALSDRRRSCTGRWSSGVRVDLFGVHAHVLSR